MLPLHPGRFTRKPSFRTVIVLHRGDVLGGGLRSTRGNVRWLAAAALASACLLVVAVGQASADPDQKLSISGPETVNEGDQVEYTVSLTDGADDEATVDFNATPGSGTSGSDFSITPDTLTVPEGGEKKFTVTANEDTTDEGNEPFTVSLSNEQGATVQTRSVTTTIIDDDNAPTIVISGPCPDRRGSSHRVVHRHDDRHVVVRRSPSPTRPPTARPRRVRTRITTPRAAR